ncbi:hypothetical protein KAR91_81490 [Candidatus Pacearchaeota archaeon]|nr:hypothetical protein [Candidatus Pacearchaeota archaeon]
MKQNKSKVKLVVVPLILLATLFSAICVGKDISGIVSENPEIEIVTEAEPQFIYEFIGEYKGADYNYNEIFTLDNYAYLCTGSEGLFIINITDPANPEKVGEFDVGGNVYAYDIVVEGDLAYLADYGDGLRVLNVSDKTNPVEIGYAGQNGHSQRIVKQGNFCYIAEGFKGWMIVNVTDPTNPDIVDAYDDLDHYLTGIDVVGDICCTADESDGMEVFDISDKTNPVKIGSYVSTYPQSHSVDIVGNYAYIANGNMGIRILDISDPTNPTKVYDSQDAYETFSCMDIQIQGDFAYTANNLDGFKIIDISDKTQPIIIIENGVGSMNRTSQIYLKGSNLYVSEDNYGMEIYRVGNDQDGDNFTEYEELNIYGSDPNSDDTDGDGILDPDELLYGTDINDADTDDDLMPDGWELDNNFDPLNATDGAIDSDEDGLLNSEEYTYNTDPWNADSDGDLFTDAEEIELGTDPNNSNSHPMYLTTIISIGVTGFGGFVLLVVVLANVIGNVRRRRR